MNRFFLLSKRILPLLTKYVAKGISIRQLEHYLQLMLSGKFRQYDFHSENIEFYNSTTPPDYDLTKVTVKLYLYVAGQDLLNSRLV